MSGRLDRLIARVIRSTIVVDRAATRFDRLRSALVTRFASDSVLEAYNGITYDATPVYNATSPSFREGLFNWEKEMLTLAFPDPPGTVLLGGSGGGREAFALAAMGYHVVAFDPSVELARSMTNQPTAGGTVQALIGRYEDLPRLRSAADGAAIDVRSLGPFCAAVLGWTSYSHVPRRAARVQALRAMSAVTDGPVAASFFLARPPEATRQTTARRIAGALGFRSTGDAFTPHIGFYHFFTPAEIEDEAREAGLAVTHACYDDLDGRWPYLVLRKAAPGSAEVARLKPPGGRARPLG